MAGAVDYSNRFGLARYDSYGRLDTSFGTGGKVITVFSGSFAFAQAVAIQSNGQIVVSGGAYLYNSSFALARYNVDGGLDASFRKWGKSYKALTTTDDQPLIGIIKLIVEHAESLFFTNLKRKKYEK